MTGYRIAELAELSGFTTTTLRYYEQVGVLDPPARTPAGYRVYDDAALDRLAFVERAKRMGFALDEIAELVRLWADGECPPVQHRMRALLDARRAAVRRQIEELIAFVGQLDQVAARLDAARAPERCGPGCGCDVTMPAAAVRSGGRPLLTTLPKPEPVTIACSLDPAAASDRLAEWRAISARAVVLTPTPTGVLVQFPADASLAAEVAALASAEASCCPFFALSLTMGDDEMHLRIDAPPGAEELARQLVETGIPMQSG